jgi:hypothetical protein
MTRKYNIENLVTHKHESHSRLKVVQFNYAYLAIVSISNEIHGGYTAWGKTRKEAVDNVLGIAIQDIRRHDNE